MNVRSFVPYTPARDAAAFELFPNAATDGATLWSLDSDNLAPNAPLVGAFFDERGLSDEGHRMCYIGYERSKFFNLMLDSTWPMHHYSPIRGDGDSPDCRFDCAKDQPDGDQHAAERNFGTRPMGVLACPANTDSKTLSEQHDGLTPEPQGDRSDPLGADRGDDCGSIRTLMLKYVSRHISRTDRARVVAHVRICDECFVTIEKLKVKIKLEAENVKDRLRRNRG
jgi:hypothetical protein